MPRLRVLVALGAGLSLLAPAAVAAGVWVHLQWMEHHGVYAHHAHGLEGHGAAHHHQHEGHEPGAEGASTPVGVPGVVGTHSHEVPEPADEPAAFRHERRWAGATGGGTATPVGGIGLAASGPGEAPPVLRPAGEHPPGPGSGPPSGPPRIHLLCALLL